MSERLNFACDYNQGAHPAILKRMLDNNLVKSGVYGDDAFSESARAKIREACKAPDADIWFLVGGTQTNAAVLDSVLRPFEGVISADTGHICIHEAGAIERGGHKVLALPGKAGKISAADILACWDTWYSDGNRTHVVKPGAVYLSLPTEVGTLYSLAELEAISSVCREKGLCLYVDGARLAYSLACPENDVTLPDLARLCDVFWCFRSTTQCPISSPSSSSTALSSQRVLWQGCSLIRSSPTISTARSGAPPSPRPSASVRRCATRAIPSLLMPRPTRSSSCWMRQPSLLSLKRSR